MTTNSDLKEPAAGGVDSRREGEIGTAEFPNQFCPVCAKRLESLRCKMVCPRCGYFMSCSEFE